MSSFNLDLFNILQIAQNGPTPITITIKFNEYLKNLLNIFNPVVINYYIITTKAKREKLDKKIQNKIHISSFLRSENF